MGDLVTHPGFHDILWHFAGSAETEGEYRVQVCPSEEDLFDRDLEGPPEGAPWRVPRGTYPTRPARSVARLDPPAILETGNRLWTSLPDALRESLKAASPLPHRLKISGETDAIALLPWECLRATTVPALVVRSVPLRYPVPPVTVPAPVRVLLLTTNPKDERLLNPWEEMAAVSPEQIPGYVTKVCDRPTRRGLTDALQAFQPHVLHYVGHGATSSGQGCLVLHDERDHTCWLAAPELAAMLPVSVRLLCLSTCFTAENYDLRALPRLAHAPADLKLPTVVVNQLPLARDSAPTVRQFWQIFYRELGESGGDVSSAFGAAQAAVFTSPDWPSFSLVLRDGTGWSLRVGEGPPAPDLVQAEFEALYSTSIANYVTQQQGAQPRDARSGLQEISRHEAQRANAALSSFGGFRLGGRRKP